MRKMTHCRPAIAICHNGINEYRHVNKYVLSDSGWCGESPFNLAASVRAGVESCCACRAVRGTFAAGHE